MLFGGVRSSSVLFEIGLTPLRVFAGLALCLAHGLEKFPPSPAFVARVEGFGFPHPAVFAGAAAGAEIIGGVLLAVGLLTRPAAFFILCTMATAAIFEHATDPFALKERAFLYGATAFAFLCLGGGRWSVDARFSRR